MWTTKDTIVGSNAASIAGLALLLGLTGCTSPAPASLSSDDLADLPMPSSITIKRTPSNGRLYIYGHRVTKDSFLACNDFDVQIRDRKSFDIKWQRNYKDSAASASYDANDDLVVIASVFDVFRLKNGGKDSTTWLRTKDLDAKDIWAGTILEVTSEYALVDDSRRVCFAKISLVKQGQVERIGVETNNPIEKFMDARISEEDLALLGVDKSKKSVYLRKSLKESVRKVATFEDDVIDATFGEGLSIFVVDALHRIWLIDGGEPRKLYHFTEPGRWVSRSSNRNGVAMWKGSELMLYQGGRLATARLSEGVFLSILLLTSDTALGTTGAPYDFVELKVGK